MARHASPMLSLIAGASVLALIALVVFGDGLDKITSTADMPTAVAPPDPGVEPPSLSASTLGEPSRERFAKWAEPIADRLDIPQTALEAYGYAESAVEVTKPGCNLNWPVLAGIGAVESRHGRYGGATLKQSGRPSVPIRGVALDGDGNVKLIRDTDNGRLDGDTEFDRAVGPMQFIPTTWKQWGRDADGDGVADPDDIDDAALTAAHYLCGGGGNLREPEQFWDAVLRYNASETYVQKVLNHADYYGTRSHPGTARR